MNTKELILKKTFRLLLEKGYDGVSISDIQETTGMARGLLYHYFKNKDELFVEVANKYFVEREAFDRESVKEMALNEMITFTVQKYNEKITDFFTDEEVHASLLNYDFFIYQTARHNETFALEYKKIEEKHFAVWKSALLNSFAKGELKSGLNLASVAKYFVYIIKGAILSLSNEKTPQEIVYEMENGLREFWEIIKR